MDTQKELRWKIYYADGNTVTNLQIETLQDLPAIGVVGIANVRDGQWWLESRRDYYTFLDGRYWWARNYSGLIIYLMQHRGNDTAVLFGQMLTNERWRNFYLWLKHDTELPQKKNRSRREVEQELWSAAGWKEYIS